MNRNSAGRGDNEEPKYPTFAKMSSIYKVLAVLCGIGGVIGGIVGFFVWASEGEVGAGVALLSVALVYGGFGVLTLLTISEGIRVFIDLEQNTRAIVKNQYTTSELLAGHR